MDNLFRSIRVSDENSSFTKAFIFLNSFQLQTFGVFSMHHSKPRHQFSTFPDFICYFSCIYWFFWAKWPWNWKALQITIRKVWKLAWYHHFTHIACAKKLRGLRQKMDALRVQNGQSLSKYEGFGWKLVCYKRISIFFNLFQLQTFCEFNMHHSKPHHQFSTLSDFIRYFSSI